MDTVSNDVGFKYKVWVETRTGTCLYVSTLGITLLVGL